MTYAFDRRNFLRASAAGAAGIAFGRHVYANAPDKNGKLRLAAIGTGGKGKDDLQNISASPRVEVVAICDVDDSQPYLGWAADRPGDEASDFHEQVMAPLIVSAARRYLVDGDTGWPSLPSANTEDSR